MEKQSKVMENQSNIKTKPTTSMKKQTKFLLEENQMPTQWYNIQADMPNKIQPLLHPGTRQPIQASDLEALFPKALIEQELTTERYIDIPEEVQDLYKIYRPTPLHRAYQLEKLLDTPAKIYYKNESVSPAGSHKTNTAIPQAYYNYKQGVKKITTETGAGQWGSALSLATNFFGIECKVFMVKVSFDHKPYRKSMMQLWNGSVVSSPSMETNAGRKQLADDPHCPGSLGIAISEAIEVAAGNTDTMYSLGSVLNHVMLHQSIIGLEAEKQLEMADDYPDIVIGPFGGGSNFGGISFPFLRHNFNSSKKVRCIAVESTSCPKLTQGKYEYDFGDTAGMTPLIPMYTLGHKFIPPSLHAGGLRYHGAGAIVSQLLKDNLIEARAIEQLETFQAAVTFSRAEGIIPAPETSHAIAQVIREALIAKEEGKAKTILFNFSGHGLLDMSAYDMM